MWISRETYFNCLPRPLTYIGPAKSTPTLKLEKGGLTLNSGNGWLGKFRTLPLYAWHTLGLYLFQNLSPLGDPEFGARVLFTPPWWTLWNLWICRNVRCWSSGNLNGSFASTGKSAYSSHPLHLIHTFMVFNQTERVRKLLVVVLTLLTLFELLLSSQSLPQMVKQKINSEV